MSLGALRLREYAQPLRLVPDGPDADVGQSGEERVPLPRGSAFKGSTVLLRWPSPSTVWQLTFVVCGVVVCLLNFHACPISPHQAPTELSSIVSIQTLF